MTVIRELIAEGWEITREDLAVLSPYLTARIQRFGVYATEEIALVPEPFDARLGFGLALGVAACIAPGRLICVACAAMPTLAGWW